VKRTERREARRSVVAYLLDHHQPVRMRVRQRLEQDGIHRTEDGGRCANAERQRKNADERKTWIVEQLARGIAQIGGKRSEEAFPSGGAHLFSNISWIAEPKPGGALRIAGRESAFLERSSGMFEVILHLIGNIPVGGLPPYQGAKAAR
jgi:hypothetical protein